MLTRNVPALIALALLMACEGGTTTGATKPAGDQAGQPAAAEDIGEVLATVNGIEIGSKEYEQAAARKTPAAGDALSAAEKRTAAPSIAGIEGCIPAARVTAVAHSLVSPLTV